MGDIPIYMSHQSSDSWAHPEIFKLDSNKKPLYVGGVPPDYFSKTGQLWGNPVYDWDKLLESNFDWWIRRIGHNLELYDILRIDHFRGFVGYWEIPAAEKTAINGKWVSAPADQFFAKLRESFPTLPIVAEDLGVITPDVTELISRLNIPNMKILLFAFGKTLPQNPYAPHNFARNCVVYTGTHDNNTVRGWYDHEATVDDIESLRRYIGHDIDPDKIHDIFVRLAMISVADTVILPMQDILGLGAEARMNIPSTATGNWEWRLDPKYLTDDVAKKLYDMAEIYGRLPKSKNI